MMREIIPEPDVEQETDRLSGRTPLKEILRTSLPAVVDLSSQTFMWTVEAILIGKIGAAAFAGVGMAIQIVIVIMTVLLTFIVGSSLIITRYLGAGNRWEANHILGQTMMLGIIMAIAISLFLYFGATPLFGLIREASGAAREAGVTYLRTVAYFGPLLITNFIAVGIIRGSGETTYSMLINVVVNTLNLILAPLLIFGLLGMPRLEVAGAALAVGISHSVGFAISAYLLRSRKLPIFLAIQELTTPNLETFKRLFRTGLPITVEQLVWALGMLVVTSYAASVGVAVLAAHQVFLRIQAILSMFYLGFGLGAMTLMGKNLGAAQRSLAEKTGYLTNLVVFIFVMGVVGLIMLFSRSLVTIFTTDPDVVSIGSTVIKIFALAQIPKAVDGALMGNLRGAGDLKWLMWLTIVSVLIFEIGINWVVVFVMNLSAMGYLLGLWTVHAVDESLRLGLNYWRFKRGKWKLSEWV
jgi:putative MATE family efflux protein